MWKSFLIVGLLSILIAQLGEVQAFDRDLELNTPDFQSENFLDIKSYQLRPDLDDEWYETTNGLRIMSGSMGLDFLYLLAELRIQQPVHQYLVVNYQLKQEEFYAIKPIRQEVEVQFHILGPYIFSLFGFPTYDKRVSEIGAALRIGKDPWNYIRFSYLEQGPYYNEKNFEEDEYRTEPIEEEVEGAYRFLDNWRIRFHLLMDRALEQYFPEEELTFKNKGEDASFILEHKPQDKEIWGMKYRGFHFEKARLTPLATENDNRQQTLQFLSTDLYWMNSLWTRYLLNVGIRYDRFRNLLRNLNNVDKDYNYRFETLQIYGIFVQPLTDEINIDYGLYTGHVIEIQDILTDATPDDEDEGIEAKLRISLEIYHPPNNGHLFFTTTWNADNFFSDFWDGGQIAYQTRF